jgi:hypothetical protein
MGTNADVHSRDAATDSKVRFPGVDLRAQGSVNRHQATCDIPKVGVNHGFPIGPYQSSQLLRPRQRLAILFLYVIVSPFVFRVSGIGGLCSASAASDTVDNV